MINIKTVCMSYLLRIKTLIIVLLSCISLTACGNSNETPQINPNPQKQVKIHGVFPFDKEMTLRFEANYAGMNASCDEVDRVFGVIEAHRSGRGVSIPLNLIRLENNQFEVFYYQDYFLSGYCDWSFESVSDHTYWSKGPLEEGGTMTFAQSENSDEIKVDKYCRFKDNTKQGWGEEAIKSLGAKQLSCTNNTMYVPFIPVLSKKATELEFNYYYSKPL